MFKCSVFILALLLLGNANAQGPYLPANYTSLPTTHNFVRSYTVLKPGMAAAQITSATNPQEVQLATQYFDGLGRPIQTVVRQGSLNSAANQTTAVDLVSPQEYDAFGREIYNFLPYASVESNGDFKGSVSPVVNPFQQQKDFYTSTNTALNPIAGQNETYFYGKTIFEASPLNRVTETYAPGSSWAGSEVEAIKRSVKMGYYFNTAIDAVRIWNVTDNSTLGNFGSYATPASPNDVYTAGQLYKNITTDEHGKQVIEFKDKSGQVILKKVQIGTVTDNGSGSDHSPANWICTYYIYDDFGSLRCVVQPEGVKWLNANGWNFGATNGSIILAEQCFRYEYDQRRRMIAKKVPGAAPVYMVYDSRDRLVLTQDGNMRVQGKWLYTWYDGLNRPYATGLWTIGTANPTDPVPNWTTRKNEAASYSTEYPATNAAGLEELTRSWYDDYGAATGTPVSGGFSALDGSYFVDPGSSPGYSTTYPFQCKVQSTSNSLKGLVTITKTKVLGSGTPGTWLWTRSFYDDFGRVIQVQSTNITGGLDIATTQYSYAGQPLTVVQRQVISVSGSQTMIIVTSMEYDALGRLSKTSKRQSHTQVNSGAMSTAKTVATVQYDALGQVKKKALGTRPSNSDYPLEHLTMEYNIRGWMMGMNKHLLDFNMELDLPDVGQWFGFDLGYNKASNSTGNDYATLQFNGNISGQSWVSAGDRVIRQYRYSYDHANRLLKADFVQKRSFSDYWQKSFNYDSYMGDGATSSSAYDHNGNIRQMQQWGWSVNSTATKIDNLTYTYQAGSTATQTFSNRLRAVSDSETPATGLGDFTNKNTTADDYGYDVNGNLVTDLNKRILGGTGDVPTSGAIIYNHLNLPVSINVTQDGSSTQKGYITYTYDASGAKLKKAVFENSATVFFNGQGYATQSNTETYYVGGAVYESKSYSNPSLATMQYPFKLQFAAHEEGRIRAVRANPQDNPTALVYDFMLKDHLGNVRMVLTEEVKQNVYPAATLEAIGSPSSAATYEGSFYEINSANIVDKIFAAGIPAYNNNNGFDYTHDRLNQTQRMSTASERLYRLNSTTAKTGLGITMKVMAGDKLDIHGISYYNSTSGNGSNVPVNDILNGFISGPGSAAAGKATLGQMQSLNPIASALYSFIQTRPTATSPKAYINYIFFDEQFTFVSGGYSRVNGTAGLKQHFTDLQDIQVPKNGYVYVYCSNETDQNVFFDNLQVIHTQGALMEETHYYPFGLTMSGISSKAANTLENKRKWNKGSELESKEFSDGTGLELYSTFFRSLDPQLGRFWQIDPRPDYSQSLYSSMSNNPIRFNDPLGDSINNPRDQRIAARIEGNINGKITSNNQSITSSRNTITSNNEKLTKLRADVASGSLAGKDLKSANKEIGKLEKSNASANANITEMQGQNALLNQSLRDIANMRTDANFNFTFGSPDAGSSEHFVTRGTGNNVIIQGSDDGLYVHEIRHVGQSLANGGLRFSSSGKLIAVGSPDRNVTRQHEVNGYQAQFSFDRNSYPAPGGARVLADINITSLLTIPGNEY